MMAQYPFYDRPSGASSPDAFAREILLRQLETQRAQVEAETAARREAEYRERQFIDKVNRFVGVWSRFVAAYNERKAFDFKSAKELSKAFHELETSGDWPRFDRK